jgi:hypothetical protein
MQKSANRAVVVHNNSHSHRCGMVLFLGLDAAQQEH